VFEKMLARNFFAQKWIDLERKAVEGEANKRQREKIKKREQKMMIRSEHRDTYEKSIERLVVKFEGLKIN